jgi:prepilin-type processing-associated H-X9-DG protein
VRMSETKRLWRDGSRHDDDGNVAMFDGWASYDSWILDRPRGCRTISKDAWVGARAETSLSLSLSLSLALGIRQRDQRINIAVGGG